MSTESYVYKKEVDWSLLTEGLTLPIDNQVVFGQIMGRFLKRGESKSITIYLEGKSYKAKIVNVNFDSKFKRNKDTLQIRYSKNGELSRALQLYFNRYEDLPIAVHYNFINIKADKLPFEYMYFLLKSEGFQRAYHLIKKQSVQEYVTIDEVANLKIALPPMENIRFEQYRYIYEMILNNQRENRYLTKIRDSILPKLMFGELDVSEIDI